MRARLLLLPFSLLALVGCETTTDPEPRGSRYEINDIFSNGMLGATNVDGLFIYGVRAFDNPDGTVGGIAGAQVLFSNGVDPVDVGSASLGNQMFSRKSLGIYDIDSTAVVSGENIEYAYTGFQGQAKSGRFPLSFKRMDFVSPSDMDSVSVSDGFTVRLRNSGGRMRYELYQDIDATVWRYLVGSDSVYNHNPVPTSTTDSTVTFSSLSFPPPFHRGVFVLLAISDGLALDTMPNGRLMGFYTSYAKGLRLVVGP